jgi:hypothetical protein
VNLASVARCHSAMRIAFAAVVVAWAVAGCAAPAIDAAPELSARIESAQTQDDHLAITAHFAKEAARARAGAASHRKAARAYSAMRPSERGNADMAAHCNSLADMYEAIANDFDALAAGHHGMSEHSTH